MNEPTKKNILHNRQEKRLGDEMETIEYLPREPKDDLNDTNKPPVDIGAGQD